MHLSYKPNTQRISWPSFMQHICMLVLVLPFFSGCKEKDPLPVFATSSILQSYCNFGLGTSWIYQDTALGLLDTVLVTQHNCQEEDLSGAFGNCLRQICGDKWKSSYFATESYYSIAGECVLDDLWVEYFDFGNAIGLFTYTTDPQGNPQTNFPSLGQEYLEARFTGLTNSLEVMGNTFDNVATFEVRPRSGLDSLVRYYWAPNVGIVKKEQVGRFQWEILSWEIL